MITRRIKRQKEAGEKFINDVNADLSGKLKSITGVIKLPIGFDEEKELTEYFEKKHLRNRR